MSVKVTSDFKNIKKRIEAGSKELKIHVTEAVITYGNIYCPEDTGDLKASAYRDSKPEDGEAIWGKDYAAENYYGVDRNFSKDRNPLASAFWAEEGVKNGREEIDQTAQKAFERGMK